LARFFSSKQARCLQQHIPIRQHKERHVLAQVTDASLAQLDQFGRGLAKAGAHPILNPTIEDLETSPLSGHIGARRHQKTLEATRFVKTDPDDMREGWETRKQRAWNATYCNNEGWRRAIDDGWSVIATITFRAGETVSFVAEC
jgi:hypothetical protein